MNDIRAHLREGQVIPAHPLALTPRRTLDERRQVALTRYYVDAGAGGVAVGVHTTQFAIREHGMYRPVLELAANAVRERLADRPRPFALVAGVSGDTKQAVAEARIARSLGFHVALVSLAALRDATDRELVHHCRAIADVLPVFGFYLQPAVGGRALSAEFWRELAELPSLWAVKIAPFNRYATHDVVRAIVEAGRDDVALYTGNDDSIVHDLVTPFPVAAGGTIRTRWMDGGLLGQWAVWTRRAVELLARIKQARRQAAIPAGLLTEGAALTAANAAIFDAAHAFAGCIPGIHEVLRVQGLMREVWCLDPREALSPGQRREIARVRATWPGLGDDAFVAEHLDRWLS
ncbi:MAG TPA: dihydrodipicolinate synthase family protein [Gemmatimonadaceae bacterium]|nr:dihydrodipicolinate synthase family protein [Gemmatimonadaceae bacterium]